MQTVSDATEEQSASMEEIAVSSRALANMAEELQGAVKKNSRFKVAQVKEQELKEVELKELKMAN